MFIYISDIVNTGTETRTYIAEVIVDSLKANKKETRKTTARKLNRLILCTVPSWGTLPYHTRHADSYHLPHARTNIRRFSVKYSGAQTWNKIPLSIRQLPSLRIFKSKLRALILDNK